MTKVTTVSRTRRRDGEATWMHARAANTQKRWRALVGLAVPIFAGILLALIYIPAGVRGLRTTFRPQRAARPDTLAILAEIDRSHSNVAATQGALSRLRRELSDAIASQPGDTAQLRYRQWRDSLSAESASLDSLLRRAQNAPLTASYRALAGGASLRRDARVRAILDTLVDVERQRDEFGTVEQIDPIYVALTTRMNALGRQLQGIGRARLANLRRELAALVAPEPSIPTGLPDTLVAATLLQEQLRERANLDARLALARRTVTTADSLATAQRAQVLPAPLPILVLTSLILAIATSYFIAFFREARRPRVAAGEEIIAETDLRVLATVRTDDLREVAQRREMDVELPTALVPSADAYRACAWRLATARPEKGIIVVTGDEASVVAAVAANIAAVLVSDSCGTLLIDADSESHALTRLLDLPPSGGIRAVLAGRRSWSEVLQHLATRPGRHIEVIGHGMTTSPMFDDEIASFKDLTLHVAPRFDHTIVCAPRDATKLIALGDVVLCAHLRRTSLESLTRSAIALRGTGARLAGVVLWEGPIPKLPKSDLVGRRARLAS